MKNQEFPHSKYTDTPEKIELLRRLGKNWDIKVINYDTMVITEKARTTKIKHQSFRNALTRWFRRLFSSKNYFRKKGILDTHNPITEFRSRVQQLSKLPPPKL